MPRNFKFKLKLNFTFNLNLNFNLPVKLKLLLRPVHWPSGTGRIGVQLLKINFTNFKLKSDSESDTRLPVDTFKYLTRTQNSLASLTRSFLRLVLQVQVVLVTSEQRLQLQLE